MSREPDPARTESTAEPGILLIQIDGLALVQLKQALARGKMPFLQGLLQNQQYRLDSLYSGLPSSTPAVQAELFYGVPTAIPAIRYLSRQTGDDCLMLNPLQVKQFIGELKRGHSGLLQNGSSYSNIYVGGASNARYCIENLEPKNLINQQRPFETVWIFLQHLGKVLRIIGLSLVESVVALIDLWKGLLQKQHIFKEIKFVPTRIWLCVILREFIRFWVKRDIFKGVPIICANFVGYDEHAHRRSPGSAFAHWSLAGIDGVLRDIHHKANQSKRRSYRLLIYSDHGQEAVVPYMTETGRSLSEGIRQAFADSDLALYDVVWTEEKLGAASFFRRGRKLIRTVRKTGGGKPARGEQIVVTALGPLGHIYLPSRPSSGAMADMARNLVDTARIPLVIYRQAEGSLLAVNSAGSWPLPEAAVSVLGPDHPYLTEAAGDLVRLAEHPDAGDFVISGWRPTGQSVSFPLENGAHGGPGSHECEGFLLLPQAMADSSHRRWRPATLRTAVLDFLNRSGDEDG